MNDKELALTRWINVALDDHIGYKALARATFIWPVLFSIPFLFLAGVKIGLAVLAGFWLAAIFSAGGVILNSLRRGMHAYEHGIEGRPEGIAVTPWHRWIYESPMAEYWIFHVGSRVFLIGWAAAVSVAGMLIFKLAPQPEMRDAYLLFPLVSLPPLLLSGRGWAIPFYLNLVAVAIYAAFVIGSPAMASAAAFVLCMPLLGSFKKFHGVNQKFSMSKEEAEATRGEKEITLCGPAISYFAVDSGPLFNAFREGGLYWRARDVFTLATAQEMAGRADASEFRPARGQVHTGGQLDGAELAARLARLD